MVKAKWEGDIDKIYKLNYKLRELCQEYIDEKRSFMTILSYLRKKKIIKCN